MRGGDRILFFFTNQKKGVQIMDKQDMMSAVFAAGLVTGFFVACAWFQWSNDPEFNGVMALTLIGAGLFAGIAFILRKSVG